MPAKPHPQRQRILDLAREGVRPTEIASKLDIPRSSVASIVDHARRRGQIPPRSQQNRGLKYLVTKTGIGYGRMKDLHDALTLEQQRWLMNECVELGVSSILEYMLELVRDAHAESTMKEERSGG